MDGNTSRRTFIKRFLSLSVFSAGSMLSFKTNLSSIFFNIGMTETNAMDNPDFNAPVPDKTIRIRYKGYSCFLITTGKGVKIITDPFSGLGKEPADIVTVSCGHYNHCDVYWVGGFPYIYKRLKPFKLEGITFKGIATRHLEMDEGRKIRPGDNYVICFEIDGMNICHLGALGHRLSSEQVNQIGKVDILMAPVGGVSTLPETDVAEVCSSLNPKIIIPMHYKNRQSNDIPGSDVDVFLRLMDKGGNLRGGRGGFGSMDFKSSDLTAVTQVIVL